MTPERASAISKVLASASDAIRDHIPEVRWCMITADTSKTTVSAMPANISKQELSQAIVDTICAMCEPELGTVATAVWMHGLITDWTRQRAHDDSEVQSIIDKMKKD